ncbi:NAD(P)-binding protein [Annulohypoxylon truncatum]|uniref:NAD(P)-binding protein n=1 Tax=Annulohypoxylon truncatum TaxID=327061 RepID=UPI0020088EB3|nr:NAD(P)-binding protein [Annulohypoxylon truncatum]KAI1207052.1 NAD(P)-binding protein [Annulohypoxylon truncatum]
MAQTVSFDIAPEKEAGKLQFLRRQLFGAAPAVLRLDVNLKGKTAVVTGANGGIGLECSRQLLKLGVSKLILAVRDEARGEAAREALINVRGLEINQTIEVWKLDYTSYSSIDTFVQRVNALQPRLDIAILNTGANRGHFNICPATGHEEDLQTNYLSTVLLTLLLLRVFKKAKSTTSLPEFVPGRIVLVSCDNAAWAKFREKIQESLLNAFDNETLWERIDRYATTKLMGQLFISELVKHVSPSLAVVNCANPGLCYGTALGRELGLFNSMFVNIFGRVPVTGARSLVHAAVRQDERSHGQYVEDGELRPMAPFVYFKEAKEVTQRLWEETMEELSFAGAQDIFQGLVQA